MLLSWSTAHSDLCVPPDPTFAAPSQDLNYAWRVVYQLESMSTCVQEGAGLHVLIPKTQIDIDEGAYCFRPLSSRSGSRSSQARPVTEDDSDINEDPDRSTRTFGNSPLRECHLFYAKQVYMSDMGV